MEFSSKTSKRGKIWQLQLFLEKKWRKQTPVKIEKWNFFLRIFIHKIAFRKKPGGPNPKIKDFSEFFLSYPISSTSLFVHQFWILIDIFIFILGGGRPPPCPPPGCSPMLTVFAKKVFGVWWSNTSIKSLIFWTSNGRGFVNLVAIYCCMKRQIFTDQGTFFGRLELVQMWKLKNIYYMAIYSLIGLDIN